MWDALDFADLRGAACRVNAPLGMAFEREEARQNSVNEICCHDDDTDCGGGSYFDDY